MKFSLEEPECRDCHRRADEQQHHEQAVALMIFRSVGICPPTHHDDDHPHEDEDGRQQEEDLSHQGMVYRKRLGLNVDVARQEFGESVLD